MCSGHSEVVGDEVSGDEAAGEGLRDAFFLPFDVGLGGDGTLGGRWRCNVAISFCCSSNVVALYLLHVAPGLRG